MLLEHVHTMDELTDEEFGKFVRAYASYIETGVEPDFDDTFCAAGIMTASPRRPLVKNSECSESGSGK